MKYLNNLFYECLLIFITFLLKPISSLQSTTYISDNKVVVYT